MNIQIKSKVRGDWQTVYRMMDRELFEYLAPPGPVRIVRYTGSKTGDVVHIRFGFPIYADWISDIVEENEGENELNFVDVGRVLPKPLRRWRHVHRIQRIDDRYSRIIDDMHFDTGFKLLNGIIFPFLYLAFMPRKWQYTKYFNQKCSFDE